MNARTLGFKIGGGVIGGIIGYLLSDPVVDLVFGYEYYDEDELETAEEIIQEKGYSDDPRMSMTEAANQLTNLAGEKTGSITNYSEKFKRGKLDLTDEKEELIVIIPQEEYEQSTLGYKRFSLTYYETDDVLVNQYEIVVESPDDIIGDDACVSFGEGTDDPDVVYVQNDDLGAMYEVIRIHDAYYSAVLGLTAEEDMARRAKEEDVED